jgi:nucleoside 2-deoxyribosyltransferase
MRSTVVLSGTYHRDPAGLRRLFDEIETTGCRVLSPLSIVFVEQADRFVRTKAEFEADSAEIERYHLRAIREADMVWLHAPDGYVGVSGSFEIGYAAALGKPVFAFHQPAEAILAPFVTVVHSVYDSLQYLGQR